SGIQYVHRGGRYQLCRAGALSLGALTGGGASVSAGPGRRDEGMCGSVAEPHAASIARVRMLVDQAALFVTSLVAQMSRSGLGAKAIGLARWGRHSTRASPRRA